MLKTFNTLIFSIRIIVVLLYVFVIFTIVYSAGSYEFSYGWYWPTNFSVENLKHLDWIIPTLSMTFIFLPWFFLGRFPLYDTGFRQYLSPTNIMCVINLFTIIPAVYFTLLFGWDNESMKQGDVEGIILIYSLFGLGWMIADSICITISIILSKSRKRVRNTHMTQDPYNSTNDKCT